MNDKYCHDCKYCDTDWYEDDDGEEYEEFICVKERPEFDPFGAVCELFKKRIKRKYKEQTTICDGCEMLRDCIQNGAVLDCTTLWDKMRHYMPMILGCPKTIFESIIKEHPKMSDTEKAKLWETALKIVKEEMKPTNELIEI